MATTNSFLDGKKIREYFEKQGICINDEEIKIINNEVKKAVRKIIKAKKDIVNDNYFSATSFQLAYPNFDLSLLPNWVVKDITNARVIGNSLKTIILPDGEKYQLNNSLNHLSGADWTKFINSVFFTSFPTSGNEAYAHNIRKIHPSPKPPQLMKDIILFFTKENELVLDFFAGVGGTLLGAALCNRKAIGIELNPIFIEAYKKATTALNLKEFTCLQGDSLTLLDSSLIKQTIVPESVSLVLLDPPYSNMMSREKTGGDIAIYGNNSTPFSDNTEDLGNVSLDTFLDKLKSSITKALVYVKKKGHIIIFMKDLQPKNDKTNLLHSIVTEKINEIEGINYKGLRIWVDLTSKYFPYGYPFCFVANQIHQYIIIFRKD